MKTSSMLEVVKIIITLPTPLCQWKFSFNGKYQNGNLITTQRHHTLTSDKYTESNHNDTYHHHQLPGCHKDRADNRQKVIATASRERECYVVLMTQWHDDTMTQWHDNTMTQWHNIINDTLPGGHKDSTDDSQEWRPSPFETVSVMLSW